MLTASQSFKLHSIVHRYFTKDEDAQAFVSEIETAIDRKYEAEKDRIATKEDIATIRQDMAKMHADLRVEIREQKAEMIKWMFIFWAGLLVAIITLVLIYVKK